MTVHVQQLGVAYFGNGTTRDFTYPFRILDWFAIHVFLDGVRQTTGYSVSGVGAANGGTVTFDVAPANGVAVSMIRATERTQLVDYQAYDAFPAETHEEALDRLTMEIQESDQFTFRAIHAPAYEAISEELLRLPPIQERAGKVMQFGLDGGIEVLDPVEYVTDHGQLTGLADDDHPQYLDAARGDARYLSLANGGTVSNSITLHGPMTATDHVVTKAYVDAVATLKFHQAVRAKTTAPITLSGLQTVDGVVLVAGDRVLVKNQALTTENGIYIADAAAWPRAADADQEGELEDGSAVFNTEGTTTRTWMMVMDNSANAPWTPGVDGATWTQIADLSFVTLDQRYLQLTGGTITGPLHIPSPATGTEAANVSWTQAEITSNINNHVAAADPHTQYVLDSEKGQPNGVATLDATGKVPMAQLPATSVFPVGSIYITTGNTNPAGWLGGTWASFGSGRVMIGVDATFTEGSTGGATSHTLTEAEIPSHTHILTDPGHVHGTNGLAVGGSTYLDASGVGGVAASVYSNTTGITIAPTGGGVAHSIMNPYIAVYFWLRTA